MVVGLLGRSGGVAAAVGLCVAWAAGRWRRGVVVVGLVGLWWFHWPNGGWVVVGLLGRRGGVVVVVVVKRGRPRRGGVTGWWW